MSLLYKALPVGRKVLCRHWGGGVLEGDMMTLLHRVVFYGDHRQSARHLTDLLNMRVVQEG